MGTDNIALVRRFIEEAWNKGNFAVVDEVVSDKYFGVEPVVGEVRGLDALKRQIQTFRTAFPDMRLAIEDIGMSGDRVYVRWTGRGTYKGSFMGIPPTNNAGDVRGITLLRLANGKIVEQFESYDALRMFQIMGVVPPLDRLVQGRPMPGAEQQRRT
jgi:steroid delta-isomerase-like uncharacterized protein